MGTRPTQLATQAKPTFACGTLRERGLENLDFWLVRAGGLCFFVEVVQSQRSKVQKTLIFERHLLLLSKTLREQVGRAARAQWLPLTLIPEALCASCVSSNNHRLDVIH
ncbi:hypothetical protein [aff. Roholtiella sp. LEGE 12411]|uniref:hypothetical protein n=1 Tax=aff. Roholtiella sp. LEGE 12411 TaxID=1828822 RepID=UPI001880268B|nr:hypothetical protein [aff. Roholtiella sp. LEGE 12411]MBE9037700.1 hypothetical protein [aff. Roholtiella sp. LEGE 12411]